MIKGLKVLRLKKIKNPLGDITKYVSKKDYFFKKFGEVYFSDIKKNKEKGWNLHTISTCLMSVASGEVVFTFCDYKFKKRKKIKVSKKNNKLLIVPPNVWFKFKSSSNNSSIVNLINNVHNDNETKKKPLKI